MTNPQVESLFRHDAFLRAMARRLLGDDVAADDVVQEAWLVALRSAKRPEEVRAGWLAGIVKNLVRRARRDVERRARRERTAARADAVTATDEACAERALRRRIAELVVGLPEIYREPLLLRYYDGLTPQAIADRLALPGSTVRTRIQRGLVRVRGGLENGNGRSLSVALLALAAPRPARRMLRFAGIAALLALTAVLVKAPPPGPHHSSAEARAAARGAPATRLAPAGDPALAPGEAAERGPTTGIPLLLEGIVHLPEGAIGRTVHLDLDGGFPALVVGDAPFAIDVSRFVREGALHVRASHPESEPQEVVAHVPGRIDLVLRRRALVPEEEFLPERTGVEGEVLTVGEEGASGGSTVGRKAPAGPALEGVVRLPPGASAAPVLVEAWRPGGARVQTLARGGARFSLGVAALLADPLPPELRVRASHPDAAPRETGVAVLFDPATGAPVLPFLEIELQAAAYLDGVVVFEGTGPAADATVAVFPFDGAEVVAAARAGADGRYRIAVDRGGSYFVAAAAPAYAPAGVAAVANADRMVLPALVLGPGLPIEGSVRAAGVPAARATVRASLAGEAGRTLSLGLDGSALALDSLGIAWQSVSVETDAAGTFAIPGLAARAYRVEVEALAEGRTPPFGTIEVSAPGVAEFDGPVARVGIVVLGEGAPLSGASVGVRREDGTTRSLSTEEGRALLLARPGEGIHLTAAASGYSPLEREILAATSDVVFDLTREERYATLVVALGSGDGVPLPSVCDFELEPDQAFRFVRRVTVKDGRFVLSNLEPGPYTIHATLPGDFLPASTRMTLASGETAYLAMDVLAAGRIVVRILTRDALPEVWLEGAASPRAATSGDGATEWEISDDTMESGLVLPGHYVLHILAPDGARSFPIEVVPGETTRLLVPLP